MNSGRKKASLASSSLADLARASRYCSGHEIEMIELITKTAKLLEVPGVSLGSELGFALFRDPKSPIEEMYVEEIEDKNEEVDTKTIDDVSVQPQHPEDLEPKQLNQSNINTEVTEEDKKNDNGNHDNNDATIKNDEIAEKMDEKLDEGETKEDNKNNEEIKDIENPKTQDEGNKSIMAEEEMKSTISYPPLGSIVPTSNVSYQYSDNGPIPENYRTLYRIRESASFVRKEELNFIETIIGVTGPVPVADDVVEEMMKISTGYDSPSIDTSSENRADIAKQEKAIPPPIMFRTSSPDTIILNRKSLNIVCDAIKTEMKQLASMTRSMGIF